MYDLHCHLLPGCDDGPPSWDAAMELARALAAQGVTTVAATPHGPRSSHAQPYTIDGLRSTVMRLREHLQHARISLQVVLGMENELDYGLVEQLHSGQRLACGSSNVVLLESPSDYLSDGLERAIYELQLAGYRVVLAHPERTRSVQQNPNTLLPLIERNVLVQITAASLVGGHGERLQQVALQLLRHGMVQLVASDAHAATGRRAPLLAEAHALVSELQGPAVAQQLFSTTPQCLLNSQPLPAFNPIPIDTSSPATSSRTRRWWSLVRH